MALITPSDDAALAEPAAEDAPVQYISHSQLDTFTQCPLRWKLEKLDRVQRAPALPLILGDAVHQALEADGTAWIERQTRLSYVQLCATFAQALVARLAEDDPEGRVTDGEHETLQRKGMAALAAYVERIQPHYQPIVVERRLETAVPDYAGLRYVGLVDGMTQPKGMADTVIVDFKVISKPWRQGDEHLKDQASAYLWLTNRVESAEGWECAPNRVTFITFPVLATPDGEGFTCTPDLRPTTRTPAQIAAYVAHVQAVAETMAWAQETGDFPARTGPLCCYCACIEHCAAGVAYARASGRPIMVPLSLRLRHREER